MLSPGTVLEDRYRIVRPLGTGGTATVYLALHMELGCLVALKVMQALDEGRFPAGALRQFRSEVRVLSTLRHPNLPTVYDVLELEQCLCLSMEYIVGKPLHEVCHEEGPLAEERILEWARQLCDALNYLHTRTPPIIYRDLKPGNVMLTEGEQIKMIDFGIAKLVEESRKGKTETVSRGMLTRGYSPVEQYVGGTDARSDIYALGATMYHLLSGTPPPDSMEVATGRAHPVIVQRADVSARTAQAIEAMMAVDRRQRPQDIPAVREMLGLND